VTSIPSAISAVRAIVSKVSTRDLVRSGAASNEAQAAMLIAQAFDAAVWLERMSAPPLRASE
jgi:hypothetical protein